VNSAAFSRFGEHLVELTFHPRKRLSFEYNRIEIYLEVELRDFRSEVRIGNPGENVRGDRRGTPA